ncbi:MAG: hypothetical protein AABY40_02735 [Nanoarchaeota archaeon]
MINQNTSSLLSEIAQDSIKISILIERGDQALEIELDGLYDQRDALIKHGMYNDPCVQFLHARMEIISTALRCLRAR